MGGQVGLLDVRKQKDEKWKKRVKESERKEENEVEIVERK